MNTSREYILPRQKILGKRGKEKKSSLSQKRERQKEENKLIIAT